MGQALIAQHPDAQRRKVKEVERRALFYAKPPRVPSDQLGDFPDDEDAAQDQQQPNCSLHAAATRSALLLHGREL